MLHTAVPGASPPPDVPTSNSVASRLSAFSKRSHRHKRLGKYYLGQTIGEGEFGKVKLAWADDESGQRKQYAIKLLRQDRFVGIDESQKIKVYHEINALQACRHPHIIRLENVLRNEHYIGIILAYASGGDMFTQIHENGPLEERSAQRLFAQLVSGVNYLHQKGIVHRDLKLENLLLDSNHNVLISDFGFANSFRTRNGFQLMKTSCGSPCYAAPEVVRSTSRSYDGRKADIWSLGVILFTFLAGYLPFDDDPQNPESENILMLYKYIVSTSIKFPNNIRTQARDLLRNILVQDPERRAKMPDIMAHAWLEAHRQFLSITPVEHEGAAPWQNKRPQQQQQQLPQQHQQQQRRIDPRQRFSASAAELPVTGRPTAYGVSNPDSQVTADNQYTAARSHMSAHVPTTTHTRTQSSAYTPNPNPMRASGYVQSRDTSLQNNQQNYQQKQLQQLQQQQQQQQANLAQAGYVSKEAYVAQQGYSSHPSNAGNNPRSRYSYAQPSHSHNTSGYSYATQAQMAAMAHQPQAYGQGLSQNGSHAGRLVPNSKPRPISYQGPASSSNAFELTDGPSLYLPRTSQPRVGVSRAPTKSGEISRPIHRQSNSSVSDTTEVPSDEMQGVETTQTVPTSQGPQSMQSMQGVQTSQTTQTSQTSQNSNPRASFARPNSFSNHAPSSSVAAPSSGIGIPEPSAPSSSVQSVPSQPNPHAGVTLEDSQATTTVPSGSPTPAGVSIPLAQTEPVVQQPAQPAQPTQTTQLPTSTSASTSATEQPATSAVPVASNRYTYTKSNWQNSQIPRSASMTAQLDAATRQSSVRDDDRRLSSTARIKSRLSSALWYRNSVRGDSTEGDATGTASERISEPLRSQTTKQATTEVSEVSPETVRAQQSQNKKRYSFDPSYMAQSASSKPGHHAGSQSVSLPSHQPSTRHQPGSQQSTHQATQRGSQRGTVHGSQHNNPQGSQTGHQSGHQPDKSVDQTHGSPHGNRSRHTHQHDSPQRKVTGASASSAAGAKNGSTASPSAGKPPSDIPVKSTTGSNFKRMTLNLFKRRSMA